MEAKTNEGICYKSFVRAIGEGVQSPEDTHVTGARRTAERGRGRELKRKGYSSKPSGAVGGMAATGVSKTGLR